MAATHWKDVDSARPITGPLLCQKSRSEKIEQLAQQSIRNELVEDGLYWVVLNLPNQTSRTLYLGGSEVDAALIEATARGAVAHALEYAFEVPGSYSVGSPESTH